MKEVVPLFSQDRGQVNLGPVNWLEFQEGFRVVFYQDKFKGVTWNHWCSERTEEKKQTQSEDQRKANCGESLRACHDLIREMRSKDTLSDSDARLLSLMFAGLTTMGVYQDWQAASPMRWFFMERDWLDTENHEKFTTYAVASFLHLLRPRSVYWKGHNPRVEDMQFVSRSVTLFRHAQDRARLQALRAFFENKVGLKGMCRILDGHSIGDKKEVLLLVWANRHLKPKDFYTKLSDPLKARGIRLSADPGSYRKQIERLKTRANTYVATLPSMTRNRDVT